MPTEPHAHLCHLIDKSLAGAASPEEEQTLRAHLAICASCNKYLEASNRAIAGLDGLRFGVDPTLEAKVLASLALRAHQLEEKHNRLRGWGWLAAVALTVVGSFAASQLGSLAAPIFHVDPVQVRVGLTTFWILPSFFVCLLFLLLPASSSPQRNKKGRSV